MSKSRPRVGPGPRRTPAEIARRRSRVEAFYLSGRSLDAIVVATGATPTIVAADLRVIRRRWADARGLAEDDPRLVELGRLDRLEREAWRAWGRSRQPIETTRVGQDSRGQKAERTLRKQAGDPRYLTLVRDCIDRRCRLLGLLRPGGDATAGPDGASLLREVEITTREVVPLILGVEDIPGAADGPAPDP